ncbi:MAG: lipid A deacylase LpxR family protein [Pseudomonadales bacterium]|jgi:hypothetical protein|nr:lipid A deacylase LpxR family protein [Pseudomonadales bacterium]
MAARHPGALACVLLLVPPLAGASDADLLAFGEKGYVTSYLDNDLFGGTDRNYTNGVRFSWISENRELDEVGPVQRRLRRLTGDPESAKLFRRVTGFDDPSAINYNTGLSLTQLMFTPEDLTDPEQPVGQRRYAGWLGLGFSLHAKDDEILNSVEFILGITGEPSLAQESQNLIHDLRNFDKFAGWQAQIPTEVTADLSFVQKRRADFLPERRLGFRVDGLTEWGVRLGSFRTSANVGGFFRIGLNLPPDFSDPRLSANAYSHRYFDDGGGYDGPWSVYGLFGATGRAVAFDATLDGPLFEDFDTGNNREPWVGEVFVGFGVRYRIAELSYVHTWRTREYSEQQDDYADFGSLALRIRI